MSCENLDFPAAYPWAACAPKPARILSSDYTGCACHDTCGEAWFKAHVVQARPKATAKPAKAPESQPRPAERQPGAQPRGIRFGTD